MREVWIDPDGFLQDNWMAVLIPAKTGVTYIQQYGGTACLHGRVEGYLVPVANATAFAELRELFEETLAGAGTSPRFNWTAELRGRLASAVSKVRMSASEDPPGPDEPLSLVESKLAETNEAWVHVVTPDGPGLLVWANSD